MRLLLERQTDDCPFPDFVINVDGGRCADEAAAQPPQFHSHGAALRPDPAVGICAFVALLVVNSYSDASLRAFTGTPRGVIIATAHTSLRSGQCYRGRVDRLGAGLCRCFNEVFHAPGGSKGLTARRPSDGYDPKQSADDNPTVAVPNCRRQSRNRHDMNCLRHRRSYRAPQRFDRLRVS